MTLAIGLQRLLGAVLGIVLFAAAFVFASVLLAIVAVAGLLLWAWIAWRGRRGVRRSSAGVVIEGEYRVDPESTPPRIDRRP